MKNYKKLGKVITAKSELDGQTLSSRAGEDRHESLAAFEVFGFLYACVALHMFCSAQSNFRSGLSVVLVLALSVFLSVSLYLFTYVSLDLFMLL